MCLLEAAAVLGGMLAACVALVALHVAGFPASVTVLGAAIALAAPTVIIAVAFCLLERRGRRTEAVAKGRGEHPR